MELAKAKVCKVNSASERFQFINKGKSLRMLAMCGLAEAMPSPIMNYASNGL